MTNTRNENKQLLSEFPFSNRNQPKETTQHIFGFFNTNELSQLREISKGWNQFIKDFSQVDDKIRLIANNYSKYFKLYYSPVGFLLHVDLSDFRVDGKAPWLPTKLKPTLLNDLPFIKKGSNASICQPPWSLYFWSSDGVNFFALKEHVKQNVR